MDVRMVVSAQTVQEYVRFFQNSSRTFWTVSEGASAATCWDGRTGLGTADGAWPVYVFCLAEDAKLTAVSSSIRDRAAAFLGDCAYQHCCCSSMACWL